MSNILYKLFEKTPYGAIYDSFTNKKAEKEKFTTDDSNFSQGQMLFGSISWFVQVLVALYLLHRCTGKFDAIHILFIIFCPCYLLCYIIYMLVAHNFCNI